MGLSAETRATLLLRIRDPQNAEAWREFVTIYEPLIVSVAKRFGLQQADADELTQDVLLAVMEKQSQYRPTRQPGSFRRWLSTVTRNAAIDRLRKQSKLMVSGGTDAVRKLSEKPDQSEDWLRQQYEQEEKEQLLAWAADEVRGKTDATTWQAFWLSFIDGKSVEETSQALRISPGQVYVARCRVLKRLREIVQQFLLEEEAS